MAAKRLTAQQRADLLKRYRGRVHASYKWRGKDGYDALWHRLIDLYRGKHFNTMNLGEEDRIAVNIGFATVNVIVPSVSVSSPKTVVWARRPEQEAQAAVLETVINYWWRHYKVQPEIGLATKDFVVIGHGWLKVGWRYVEQQKMVAAAELQEARDANGGDDTLVPEDPNEHPENDESSSTTEADPEFEVVEDRPFVERVSIFDMFVDPEAKTLEEATWIAQRIVKPLGEVRQDKRYRLKGRQTLMPDSQVNPEWVASDSDNLDVNDVKRVTLWEFYDLRLGTMCVFTEQGSEMLIDPIPQPYAFGHPFVMLRNYEVPDMFYPMGDLEALEPLQMELDKTRSQMMNHRKAYNRKWLYDPNAFDPTAMSMLNSDQDNLMVPMTDGNRPLNEVIFPIPINPPNPALYQYEEGLASDMDRVSGVSEFQRGDPGQIRHTATEASMIQDAANSRASDKLSTIEICCANVAERVVQLAQQYMTKDQVVRLIGKNGYPIWIPYTRKSIQGEYDFEVEAGSTQPQNDTMRRNQAMQLLQALTPWAQGGLVNPEELLKYALTYGFQVKNPDSFLAKQPPGGQQPGEQQKSPKQTLVESMNYKDTPPDIQRQIEEAAGMKPSEVGGSSPAESMLGKVAPQMAQGAQQAQGQQAQVAAQMHQAGLQNAQHSSKLAHDATVAHQGNTHELTKAALQAHHEQQMAALQHQQQLEQAEQAAQHGQAQTVLQGAMAPQPGEEGGGEGNA